MLPTARLKAQVQFSSSLNEAQSEGPGSQYGNPFWYMLMQK